MSDVNSLSGLTAKMILATAFIDGHFDDKESERITNIIKKFGDFSTEEIMKIFNGFKGLDASGVVKYISPEIKAISMFDDNLKKSILITMLMVTVADGKEHDYEQALIKICETAWGIS